MRITRRSAAVAASSLFAALAIGGLQAPALADGASTASSSQSVSLGATVSHLGSGLVTAAQAAAAAGAPAQAAAPAASDGGRPLPADAVQASSVVPAGVIDEAAVAVMVSKDGSVSCAFWEHGEGQCGALAAQDGRHGADENGQPKWMLSMTGNNPMEFSSYDAAGDDTPWGAAGGDIQVVEPGQTVTYGDFACTGTEAGGMTCWNLTDKSIDAHFEDGDLVK